MILLDFSGTIVAAAMRQAYLDPDALELDAVRRSVLATIRNIRSSYRNDYGQLVIACDGKDYWRKSVFPYYKIKRQKAREEGVIDWNKVHSIIEIVKEEIKIYLPYPVVEVNRAEADDVIACIIQQETLSLHTNQFLILSRDKDLKQLQINPNVRQFNSIDNRWEFCSEPNEFKFEHIVRGDVGDSIPNIYSPENSIAIGQRQKAITEKRLAECRQGISEELRLRYEQNKKLIDLTCIPNDLYFDINEVLDRQINKEKQNLGAYLRSVGLNRMAEGVQDFR